MLTDNNPGARTPGGREEEDEDGNEGNLGVDGRDVVGNRVGAIVRIRVGKVEADGHTNDSHDELADQHAESAIDEDSAATEPLDGPEREGGRAHVDKGEDERDQEGVADGASSLQEGGGEIEDEVDTSPILRD